MNDYEEYLQEEGHREFMAFKKWNKTPRFEHEMWQVTEKIDGTNACVVISADGAIWAQSRTRIIFPGAMTDNLGFAKWVEDNKKDLLSLGRGYHYGEWWGRGIQRRYGQTEKIFSLFRQDYEKIPTCCRKVPLICSIDVIHNSGICSIINNLMKNQSVAVPGWEKFEGLIFQSTLHPDVRYKYIVNKYKGDK